MTNITSDAKSLKDIAESLQTELNATPPIMYRDAHINKALIQILAEVCYRQELRITKLESQLNHCST